MEIIGNEEPDRLEALPLPPAPAHDVPILGRTDYDIRELKVFGIDCNLPCQHYYFEVENSTLSEYCNEVLESLFTHELIGGDVD